MDFVAQTRRKGCLLMGLAAGILYGIGDILLGYYGQSGAALFGGVVNTDIAAAPMAQFVVSFVLGLAAAPLLWAAGSSMNLCLQDWAGGRCPAARAVFAWGMRIMVLCAAAAHSVCCVAMMCIKAALEQGMSAAWIEAAYQTPLLFPFVAANLWVTVSELLVSASYLYLAAKGVLRGPKWLLLCNPVCIYILVALLGTLALALTGDAQLKQLFAGGASFGYGLMFFGCYLAAKRAETQA